MMIEAPPTEKEGQTETQRRERGFFISNSTILWTTVSLGLRKTLYQRGHFCMFSVIFFFYIIENLR